MRILSPPTPSPLLLLLLSLLMPLQTNATSILERRKASDYPEDASSFYDITYDESICPKTELKSHALPDYVYFGTLLATFTVDDHTDCLQECLLKPECQSVNYYRPEAYQIRGFCELLSETQLDDPKSMMRFKNAIYFEHIKCRTEQYDYDSWTTSDKKQVPTMKKTDFGLKKLFGQVKKFNTMQRLRQR